MSYRFNSLFIYLSHKHFTRYLKLTSFYKLTLCFFVFHVFNQVRQEISIEAKHVKDIMKTLESFKLDSTPLKAAHQELPAHDGEVWSLPVPAERR